MERHAQVWVSLSRAIQPPTGRIAAWPHPALPLLLWAVWAVAVIGAYYRQLWRFLLLGPGAWEVPPAKSVMVWLLVAATALAGAATLQTIASQSPRSGAMLLVGRLGRLLGLRTWRGLAAAGILVCSMATTWVALLAGGYGTSVPRTVSQLLPALHEALPRALSGIVGASAIVLCAQVVGGAIYRLLRCDHDDKRDMLLFQTSTGLGALAYLSGLLAVFGLYSPFSLAALVAVVMLCGLLWLYGQRKRLVSQRSTEHVRSREGLRVPQEAPSGKPYCNLTWMAITALGTLIAFVGALAPEVEYDALWYHLGLPKLWLQRGTLIDDVGEYVSLYPMTWELISGLGLVLGGPVAAKLLHFACLPLGALLTFQIARRVGGRTSPWLAVALFTTAPIVLWEATTAYVDLALALYVGLTLYALLRYVERWQWQWLALAAIQLGLALAIKHLALFVLALLAAGLAINLKAQGRSVRQALAPALFLGLVSLLFALPWYTRSWLASGNPVFPELFEIFGAQPPERWDAVTERGLDAFKSKFGQPVTITSLATLPWDTTVHAARYGGTLGPLFVLLIPALVLSLFRPKLVPVVLKDSATAAWLLGFVLLYVMLWVSPFSSMQMRFLVPIVAPLAVLAAAGYAQLGEFADRPLAPRSGMAVSAPVAGVAVLLLLNLPPFIALHEGDRSGWMGWLTHVTREVPLRVVLGRESERVYLSKHVASFAAWQYINAHLLGDARVLTFSGGDHYYAERDRLWSEATLARPATWGAVRGQENQAIERLRSLGISHVLFDLRQLSSGALDNVAIAQPAVVSGCFERVYADRQFALYRVRWEVGPQVCVQV